MRFSAEAQLTRAEIQQLKAKAAADLRSISNYVSKLVVEHLRRAKHTRKRGAPVANPGDRRASYHIAIQISPAEKKKLQARARAEMRSVSNYVAKLVIEDLRRRRDYNAPTEAGALRFRYVR